jgi:very-short-patch-repair endonuclease
MLRPVRLACDLAWFLGDPDLESVFEQLIDRRLASIPALRAAAKRFCACGRPGSERLGRVLESRPAWLRPADSDLEVRVMRGLRQAGLDFESQVSVVLDSGSTVHLDLADRTIKLGIEVDHVTWHGGRLDAQRDKRRDRQLTRQGWTICRVTDDDLTNRYAATLNELVEIVQHRYAQL